MKKVVSVIMSIITVLFILCVCFLVCSGQQPSNAVSLQSRTYQRSAFSPSSPITPDGKININTATAEVLTYLPGIGEVLAKRIVEYREENGLFTQATDLLNVKGIGKGKLNKMIDYIALE